jgi:hypothetical protein
MLRPSDRGVEFGSGRSTVWFAERVAHLTSVEHDEQWHSDVSATLKDRGLTNVDYVLAPWDPDLPGDQSDYVGTLSRFAESSMDFALIDGAYRNHAARLAMPRIKPRGLLIIDNVNWFLPSESRAPASRSRALGPEPGGPISPVTWLAGEPSGPRRGSGTRRSSSGRSAARSRRCPGGPRQVSPGRPRAWPARIPPRSGPGCSRRPAPG